MLTVVAERLDQTHADALTRHLNESERGHLGHLMASSVPTQALDHPPQHEVTVGLQHHVDVVDDDDSADVTQPELAHDLLGRFQVVLGHRLLEVAPRSGELAGVDVDDGHRLGAVDHQRASRGEVDLAVQRLGDLLLHPVGREDVGVTLELLQALGQVGGDLRDIALDRLPGGVTLDGELREVFGEQVAHDLQGQVRLAVQQLRGLALGLGLDVLPAGLETFDVAGQLLLGGALGRGPHDHSGGVGNDVLEQRLEAVPLGVRQLA